MLLQLNQTPLKFSFIYFVSEFSLASIIESIDQDGDSYDWDGDGYSIAQELQYGTNPNDADDYPNVPALPLSNWIDEDDFSYSMDGENCQRNIYGIQTEGICQINVDDDGDCERLDWVLQNQLLGQGGKDSNYDKEITNLREKLLKWMVEFKDPVLDAYKNRHSAEYLEKFMEEFTAKARAEKEALVPYEKAKGYRF